MGGHAPELQALRTAVTLAVIVLTLPLIARAASHVSINPDGVLLVDRKGVFPIGFTMPPPADGKMPTGNDAIGELHEAGATFLRTGVMGKDWDEEAIAQELRYQDAAAKYGMHCWVFLRELGSIPQGDAKREAMLR